MSGETDDRPVDGGGGHTGSGPDGPSELRETPATFAFMGLFLAVFLGVRVLGVETGSDVVLSLAVQSDHLGRVWTWVTSVFVHGVPVHLLANAAVCYWVGSGVERGYGTRRFVAVFLVTGVASGVLGAALSGFLTCGEAAFAAGGCEAVAGGASGALLGVVGYSAARTPSLRVQSFPGVTHPLWVVPAVVVVVSVLGLFTPVDPLSALLGIPVKHGVHLVGVLVGLALGSVRRPGE